MLHPITLLFWLFFTNNPSDTAVETAAFSGPASTQASALSALQQSPIDSAFFLEIKEKIEDAQKNVPPEKLYLHFDRSLLKPGETLWFNAYLLNAGNLMPSIQSQMLQVDLLNPQGAVIQSKKLLALQGIAAGEFDFPATSAGGMYKIRAYSNWMLNFNEVFERNITLQNVVLPRINLKLEFERKGIGAGETAIARFDAQSLDNQPIAGQTITFNAAVAGNTFQTGEAKTDANGRAYVRFEMPEKLESADGLLNVQLEYGGQNEAISRPIPIVLNKIDLQFFPEGGDAVIGLTTSMAFKAVNEFGKPADVEGTIHDSQGTQVATFSSYHDGMGAFDFLPKGGKYEARLTKPFVSEKPFPLPLSARYGFTLHLKAQTAESLNFEVNSTETGKVYLLGQAQDKLFFFKELTIGEQQPSLVEVPTEDLPMGIARFTLFDRNEEPMAERLVFVNRDKGLKIDIKPDKDKYLPRDKVKLNIHVADHKGKPVQGKFSLGVTDESLLTFADDKQGHLLSSLLLEQDVKGKIEEPNFYFDPKEAKAAQALDYLLMTQGWRRFDWGKVLRAYSPVCYYPAERAEVSGKVVGYNNKPLAGEKVKLYPNGPSMVTDEEGRFSFINLSLDKERYSHIVLDKDERYYINGGFGNYILQPTKKTAINVPKTMETPSATGTSYLCGSVVDDIGEALIGASVKVMRGNDFIRGAITDLDGNYRLAITPGVYNLEFTYTGFNFRRVNGVQVRAGKMNLLGPIRMSSSPLTEVLITAYKVPLIEQDNTSGGQTLTSDQIRNLPVRSVNAIMASTAGTSVIDGTPVNVRGSRSNATNYYIDGIRLGGAQPENSGLAEVAIIAYTPPMIRVDDMSTGRVFSSDQLVPRSSSSGKSAKRLADKSAYYYTPAVQFHKSREFYVPQYKNSRTPPERTDFRATLYWNPAVQTNKLGEASVEFYTSDAITNFRATLEGLSHTGQPGRCEQQFFAQKPVSIDAKLPATVITGDILNLEIVITNNTDYPVGGNLSMTVPGHFEPVSKSLPKGGESVMVPARSTKTIAMPYKIGLQTKNDERIRLQLSADEIKLDAFESSIRTLNTGFPVQQVMGGFGQNSAFNITLLSPVENTVSATLTAYPNPLADVLVGMDRMLRQPSGCFEQVSSSNYPNLLVLDLLRQLNVASPEIESRAMNYLDAGYQKLTGYECKSGGFDWYGRDPGHEGLTAYGVLQFTDMAKVFPVDKTMIDRTVKWLSSRRDGNGGWTINPNSLHGWKNDPVLDCYIVWALAEAGYGKMFSAEIAQARKNAIKNEDPYQLALLSNALLAMGDPQGKELLGHWIDKQAENGSWIGNTHSAMYASGDCYRIETTALTALALMKTGKKSATLAKAMEYILKAKTSYGYGSTQSTVMALKALIQYAKFDNGAKEGHFNVLVDGKQAGGGNYSTTSLIKLDIPNLEKHFSSNNPKITVVFDNDAPLIPFDLEVKYASMLPQNASNCPLSLSTTLAQTAVSAGETVRLSATLQNNTAQAQASPMVVLGIPSGASLQPWQLKKLVDEHKCAFYELWDGFAVFHFDGLQPNESRQLNLDLRADVRGVFDTPASQAFLYYTNDQRVWSKPERLEIR